MNRRLGLPVTSRLPKDSSLVSRSSLRHSEYNPVSVRTYRTKAHNPQFKIVEEYSSTDGNNIVTKGGSTQRGSSFSYTDALSGFTNPRWKDQVRLGVNATTTLTGNRCTYEIGWISASMEAYDRLIPPTKYNTDWYGHVPVDLPSGAQPAASLVTSVTNRAISKFLDRADSARSSVESGQDFGEIKESLNGLVNPLSSLRRHVLSYFPRLKKIRGKYKKPADALKALSDTYLEWTFGWKPLALDIADAYVGLRNRNSQFNVVPIHASAHQIFEGNTSNVLNATSFASMLERRTFTRSYSEYSVRFKGAVRTGAVNGSISAAQVLQIDLPHFVPTLWDLLPYSFIVDYFTNVGDVIRAYSMRKSDITWICKTIRTKRRTDVRTVMQQTTSTFGKVSSYLPGDCNSWVETVDFQRSAVSPSSMIPTLQFEVPVSSKPWKNLAALLISKSIPLVPFFKL